MSEKRSELKTGALLSYVNLALSSLIPFFYTPVMLRILGSAEYGLYSLAGSVIGYLSLLNFGFGGTIIRYLTVYRARGEKEEEEKVFGFYLLVYVVIAALVLIGGQLISEQTHAIFHKGLSSDELSRIGILTQLMAINLAISFPSSVFSAVIVAHEKYVFRRMLDIVGTILAPVSNLIALYLGYASVGMVVSSTIIQVLMLLLNTGYCIRRLGIRPRFAMLPVSLIKEMLVFASFVFIGSIVDVMFWATDKVILGMLASSTAVGVYNIGCTFNGMLTSLSSSLSGVLTPRVTAMAVKEESNDEFSALFIRVGRIQFLIVALVVAGFTVFGQSFLRIWAGVQFSDSYWIAILTMYPLCIPLIQNTGISILTAKNKHWFRSCVYLVIAALNVISTYLVVPKWGGIGAAACSAMAYLAGQGIIMNLYYHKVIGIDIPKFWRNIGSMAKVPIAMLVIGVFTIRRMEITNWSVFFCGVILFSSVYILGMYFAAMDEYEKNMLRKLLKLRV